jgi:hypothetical protein
MTSAGSGLLHSPGILDVVFTGSITHHSALLLHEAASRSFLGTIGHGIVVLILVIFFIGLVIGLVIGFVAGRLFSRRR